MLCTDGTNYNIYIDDTQRDGPLQIYKNFPNLDSTSLENW